MNKAVAACADVQEQQSKLVENRLFEYSTSKVLIAEDSSTVRRQIAQYLTHYGLLQIRFAKHGGEALEVATQWYPDLILTDLHMPVMDGFELCRNLRADPAFDDVPILVLTGTEKHEEHATVFEAGATDLIRKPVYHMELVGRLQVHLERSQLIKRLTEYKEWVALELDYAKTMQVGMLPDRALINEVLETYPVDVASHYQPSIGLGGDLWGIRPLSPNRLFFYILDFSGHGVGAAINTFRFQTFYKGVAGIESPAQLMEKLNGFLKGILPIGQFATMFCAIVDFERNEMTYSSAGAPPTLVRSDETGGVFASLDGSGFPLGLRARGDYQNATVPFLPGSTLFLYSDALVETPEPPHSVFDYSDLAQFLGEFDTPQSCVDRVVGVLSKVTEGGDAAFNDDVTIFCLAHLDTHFRSDQR
ncbi:MAG: SpoIIE family protein phosphatase [Roseibium sp.]|uniref:SpoIIE family protein phosphatase n=2 Tax=Roseibium sp. TaxID=1936156 RepID=UPI001B1CEF36|nr:SpoIIE family protein phosphatase [Roseibium sp.]MBO6892659.1 SpoIIE family protein phosphatase [Roseibium sp.]MBO6928211.1 SpoIIE family protein phosphatase [Roseibium sp.]